MERKTPLYQTHVDAGGKIVEFGGFLMPVQYPTGVLAEHMAVRQKAGLFDVSHMGELRLKGPDAPETLNSDPYGAWIIKVEGIGGTEELLDAAAYEAHCAEEG